MSKSKSATSIRIDSLLLARVRIIAEQENTHMSAVIENAIRLGLDHDFYTRGLDNVKNLLDNQRRSFRQDKDQIGKLTEEADRTFKSHTDILEQIHNGDMMKNIATLLAELAQESVLPRLTKIFESIVNLTFTLNALSEDLYSDAEKYNAFLEKIEKSKKSYYGRKDVFGNQKEKEKR